MNPQALLGEWLARRLSADAAGWLADGAARLRDHATDRDLYLLVSLVARRVGKDDLALTATEFRQAEASRPGWDPREWTLDQAARVHLLLASSADGIDVSRRLDRLCSAADVGELVAFYRGLPLYPDPPRHTGRAAEGVRSNIRVVFEAVAHRNPYPAEQFAEPAWNQMVLKALFVGSRLDRIVGLDRRANPDLAQMLVNYAHERWAASRPVSPELWRCVGPFADDALLDDFQRLFVRGSAPERQAGALALAGATNASATRLLESQPELAAAARSGMLTWAAVAAAGN